MLLRLAIVGVATAASGVHAFFRMPCSHLVSERVDSIVNPGAISGHVHTVVGGSAFNMTQTYESSLASKCTSCKAVEDKSNYWTPSLYYQAQNGSFTNVPQVGGMLIYYLQRRSSPNEKLHAFPPGFKMLAGDNNVRSYNNSNLAQRAVSWTCLDYKPNSPYAEEVKYIPNHICPNGLRSQIFFPSCWDGVNLDSPDHKSHMAYPDGMDNGKCPPTHPVRFVSIFFETIWDTAKFDNMWWKPDGHHPFVLSNGDPEGYAFHGDFFNGWPEQALQTAIDNCNQDSGKIEDCPGFLKLQDDSAMNDCAIPPIIDEQVFGWMDSLPGCNPVQPGPNRATAQTCNEPAPAVIPPGQASFMKNTVPLWDPVGCAKDDLNNRLLPKKYTPAGMTIEKCVDQCRSAGYKYAGLQYASECWCGNTFDESKANLMGSCNMPCQGDPTEMCGAGAILSVYKYNPNKVVGTKPSSTIAPPPASSSAVPPKPSSSVVVPPPASSSLPPKPSSSAAPPKPSSSAAPPKPSSSAVTPPKPSSSAVPPPPPASSTVAPPPSSSAAPPPQPSAGNGWTSAGCYVDPVNPRALTGTWMWYDVPMTGPACMQHCDNLGYSIAGTEYAGECWCGNKLDKAAVKAPEKECNMKCKGDSSTTCGGAARMNIFTKSKPSKRSVPENLLTKKSSRAHHARRHNLRSDLIH